MKFFFFFKQFFTLFFHDDCDDINLCGSANGYGSCVDSTRTIVNTPAFTCNCIAGYEEFQGTCVEINECDSDPCQNGAVCNDKINGFKCGVEITVSGITVYQCPSGWQGDVCGDNIDECSLRSSNLDKDGYPLVCGEHGTCTDTDGSYSCSCNDNWLDADCRQEPITEFKVPLVMVGNRDCDTLGAENGDSVPLPDTITDGLVYSATWSYVDNLEQGLKQKSEKNCIFFLIYSKILQIGLPNHLLQTPQNRPVLLPKLTTHFSRHTIRFSNLFSQIF